MVLSEDLVARVAHALVMNVFRDELDAHIGVVVRLASSTKDVLATEVSPPVGIPKTMLAFTARATMSRREGAKGMAGEGDEYSKVSGRRRDTGRGDWLLEGIYSAQKTAKRA